MNLAERLLKLVEIESVTGNERALCEFLLARAQAAGPWRVDCAGNAFALRPVTRQHRELVALVGHLDTVPPSAANPPNPPRIEGDRLCGLGAADMKSGLALMWSLLEQPVVPSVCDLAFIFYDREEGPYHESGLGPLLAQLDWLPEIDLALCLEPSDNVLQLGCLGSLHAEVTFAGRAAHSARPWQGENAIYRSAPLLARLAAFPPQEVRCADLVYREVISATLARGGTARNVVPDRFTLNLNFRFAPGRSLDSAQQVIRELVADEGQIEFVDLAPAGAIPQENALLARFRQVCAVPAAPKQAWTDVARFTALGVDAINFGPGDNARCHQPDESTSIAMLNEGDRLLRLFLAG